jgi:rubrerythrin
MSEAAQHIAQGLAVAMQTETDGYHFYLMAAQATQDEKGKEVFTQLAEEELDHLRFLKAQHESFVAQGRADPSVKVGRGRDLSGASPIFSAALRARIGDAHFEMSALSIGITLELGSETHYREQAGAAGDPEARAFFEALAEWEAGHYRALSQQLEELKEDYWSGGGFAPW